MKCKLFYILVLILLTKVIIYDNFVIEIFVRFDMGESNLRTRQEVADKLRMMRGDEGMTQEHLASLIGTKKSNIWRLESGRYNPSLDFLVKVAEGLGKQIQVQIK